ncbi:MAG: ABC transporter ATP-binding protein [Desulfobacteraceae bacterium]|nr:ABC transporter ATP-binding protein [Desulfobacteraceae bacterium]MBC2757217.1 ABC transporter ATP-binding protein [Desulfobacteraceae bacterium]
MKKNPVIEVKNVTKSFKSVQAVKGVDFKIFKGQSVALLGPNGAGKTTLMEMIEGIQKPDKGEIFISGKKWKGNESTLHREIGLSLQETHFLERLTVFETLKLFASFYELGQQRVDEIIRIIGLQEKIRSYVVNLSGGQRQRLALGIALLNDPKILLLDEPTTGLDPNARREIWSILMDLKKHSQTSLVLTTHYMEEAEQLCERIIIIDKGRILKQGTLEQLLEEDNGDKIIEFALDESNRSIDGVSVQAGFQIQWDANRDKGVIVLNQIERQLPEFLNFLNQNNLRLRHLECRRKTLDDLFTTMTGRRLHE